jgi:hypothetical protein
MRRTTGCTSVILSCGQFSLQGETAEEISGLAKALLRSSEQVLTHHEGKQHYMGSNQPNTRVSGLPFWLSAW